MRRGGGGEDASQISNDPIRGGREVSPGRARRTFAEGVWIDGREEVESVGDATRARVVPPAGRRQSPDLMTSR